ncbi:MAG: hypothetical protein ACMUEL_00015 [Flavobacteriales bacterium Tduv]
MFKDPDPVQKNMNIERTEETIETLAEIFTTAFPFCKTMLADR